QPVGSVWPPLKRKPPSPDAGDARRPPGENALARFGIRRVRPSPTSPSPRFALAQRRPRSPIAHAHGRPSPTPMVAQRPPLALAHRLRPGATPAPGRGRPPLLLSTRLRTNVPDLRSTARHAP